MGYSGDGFDVIIVGAGVMGSSTAYQLAKRGKKALLLEQFDFLHQCGSSHGESRTIRGTYPEDYYYGMVKESYQMWELIQSEIGFRVYFKAPQFDMAPSDDKSILAVISTCQKHDMPHQVLNRQQVAEKFSGRFEMPEGMVGVSCEYGGVIKPTKAVSMFQTLAMKNGAVLRDNIEVNGITKDETSGGIMVSCSNGEKFWGKKCVITAGAWMKKLVKTVNGIELPIQPLETNVCYWRIKEGHEAKYAIGSDFPTFTCYGNPYMYGTPSLEYPRLIKIAVHGGYPCDQDRRPWGPGLTPTFLKEWIDQTFNGMVDSSEPAATQLCMYSKTPDEDFVIDFLGGEFEKDVVIGGGFSGHGFKMAPAIGRILADLVLTGEAKGVELKYFRIARFEENQRGNIKDFEHQVGLHTN